MLKNSSLPVCLNRQTASKKMKDLIDPRYGLILTLFVIWSAGFPVNAVSQAGSLNIPHTEASPGELVLIPVSANGFQGFIACDLYIHFNHNVLSSDPDLNVVTNLHPQIANSLFNVQNDSVVSVSWFSMNPANIPDGEILFELQMRFCDDSYACAQNGTASDLIFLESHPYVSNLLGSNWAEIPLEYNDGSVFAPTLLKTLDILVQGNGEVFVDGAVYSEPLVFQQFTSVEILAQPAEGEAFISWQGDLSGDNPVQNLVMESHKLITANFSPSNFTATFVVKNNQGDPVDQATVILNGSEQSGEDNVFSDLLPGTYDYFIEAECYMDAQGEISINQDDVMVYVELNNIQGDANDDGAVNVLDAIGVLQFFEGENPLPFCFMNADVNGDGAINVLDAIAILSIFLES